MGPKYISLNDGLHDYVCRCRTNADDPILAELRTETNALGEVSKMQISQEQGTFMGLLVAAMSAKSALEIGTFTGYSSLCIARALGPSGRLICLDESKDWTAVARKYWHKAGIADRIDLRLAPAIKSLQALPPDVVFDFVFVDAEKTEYDIYYELALPHLRTNGLILFDNMLWGGRLGATQPLEASGRAIDKLNLKLATDERVEAVLLPIADGLQLCRKR